MTPKEVLTEFFKAENERDWDTYRKFLHEEVVWVLYGKEERRICGIQQYLQMMQKAYAHTDVQFRCLEMRVSKDGKRVMALLVNEEGAHSLDIFDFQDNLIYREYEFLLD